MNNETFSKFGKIFQLQLLSLLLTNREFLEKINDVLLVEYFETEATQQIYKCIKKYYEDFHDIPSMNVMVHEIQKIQNESIRFITLETLKDSYSHINDKDLMYIDKEVTNFCKNQEWKNAILESVEFIKNGDYDKIKDRVDKAEIAGTSTDIGVNFFEDYEVIFDKLNRKVINTPWTIINDLTDGGAGKGELHIAVGGPGTGKTWLLASIGAEAIKQGKNVIHYTLELSREYVMARYCSILTGIPPRELKYHKEEIIQLINKLKDTPIQRDENNEARNKILQNFYGESINNIEDNIVESDNNIKTGKLLIQYYPDGCANINTLFSHIKKSEIIWGKPDMIIVDYGDNLDDHKATKNTNSYQSGGNIYKGLRGLAGIFSIPVWTASQAGREGETSEIVEGKEIAESYKKIMIGDFIFSLSRTKTDKVNGTGRIFIIKNRFGPDGLVYPAKIDNNIGKVEIYEPNSIKGQDQMLQMSSNNKINNDLDKNLLKQKYQQMFKGD